MNELRGGWSVFELLTLLCSPAATRHRHAVAALMQVVRRHVAGVVSAPRGAPLRVPDRAREDVAANVMEALVRDGGKIVARMIARSPALEAVRAEALGLGRRADHGARFQAHRATDLYLRRMVATSWILILRREAREPKASTPTVDHALGPSPVERAEEVDRAMHALAAAVAVVASARADVLATYQEMWDLAMHEQTMDACIARNIGLDASPAAVRAARDRLQQRHRRLRVLLVKALDELESKHSLNSEDARFGRSLVAAVLNRVPRRRSGRSE